MYALQKIWNPPVFQGKHKTRHYFEGWYFKLVSGDQRQVLAIIPGISHGKKPEDSHAFIQVIDGLTGETHYIPYPLSTFYYSDSVFEISIGDNFFSDSMMQLSLFSPQLHLHGTLSFSSIVPFPRTSLNPGIMGPFSFVPFMECYHDVVNIHHDISGSLKWNKVERNFHQGYGYIEKDWGRSFPEAWIWLQSNHFETGGVSVMFSIARIPWLNKHFIGHIAFLRIEDRFYRFATYSGSAIRHLKVQDNSLAVTLQDRRHILEIEASCEKSGLLKAPRNGLMDREILESIDAEVHLTLKDAQGTVVFEDTGRRAGFEQMGADIFQTAQS
jgi:tocopherol cyclase